MNGNVWVCRTAYKNVHSGFGYGIRNTVLKSIFDFALIHFGFANTWFKKKDRHLVNFRTRVNATKTDYFLTRLIDKGSFLNSKVRVILDVRLQARPKVKRTKDIKWCRLKEDNAKVFAEKVIKEADWKMTSNVEDT